MIYGMDDEERRQKAVMREVLPNAAMWKKWEKTEAILRQGRGWYPTLDRHFLELLVISEIACLSHPVGGDNGAVNADKIHRHAFKVRRVACERIGQERLGAYCDRVKEAFEAYQASGGWWVEDDDGEGEDEECEEVDEAKMGQGNEADRSVDVVDKVDVEMGGTADQLHGVGHGIVIDFSSSLDDNDNTIERGGRLATNQDGIHAWNRGGSESQVSILIHEVDEESGEAHGKEAFQNIPGTNHQSDKEAEAERGRSMLRNGNTRDASEESREDDGSRGRRSPSVSTFEMGQIGTGAGAMSDKSATVQAAASQPTVMVHQRDGPSLSPGLNSPGRTHPALAHAQAQAQAQAQQAASLKQQPTAEWSKQGTNVPADLSPGISGLAVSSAGTALIPKQETHTFVFDPFGDDQAMDVNMEETESEVDISEAKHPAVRSTGLASASMSSVAVRSPSGSGREGSQGGLEVDLHHLQEEHEGDLGVTMA